MSGIPRFKHWPDSAVRALKALSQLDVTSAYYEHVFRRKILTSSPIDSGSRGSRLELHIVTSEKDILNALWVLKSFYLYSRLRPRLVVHGDPSFGEHEAKMIKRHFPGSSVILKKTADHEVKRYLKGLDSCYSYRFEKFHVYSMKLFDFQYYSEGGMVLTLDSDVLFFDTPSQLCRLLEDEKGFFMADYQNAYCFNPEELKTIFGIDIVSKVNSGLFGIRTEDFNLAAVEEFLKIMETHGYPNKAWVEQTAMAMLVSDKRERFERLDERYGISDQQISEKTVAHHFVKDARTDFYRRGLRKLDEHGFLSQLKGC